MPVSAPEEPVPLFARSQASATSAARPQAGCACGGGCPSCGTGARSSAPAGVPLEPAFRAEAEARLGVPLGDVRLTTAGPLGNLARARVADAAAAGNVLAFPGGLPEMHSAAGRFAIGHELGHLARDRGGNSLSAGEEAHADAAGRALGGPQGATGAPDGAAHPRPERLGGQPVHFGIFDPIGDLIADPPGYVQAALPGLHAAALQVLARLPGNTIRLVIEIATGIQAAELWMTDLVRLLVQWQGSGPLFDHLVEGVSGGALGAGEVLGAAVDALGIDEFARSLFFTSGALDGLTASEESASRRVHPPGLIPYAQVMVDRGGIIARIAAIQGSGVSIGNQLFGTSGVLYRSVTTMHVIHTGTGPMSPGLAVHELTHVGQYTMSGAQYMAQALHAQLAGEGYDYAALDGSLSASIAVGRSFLSFNREQQAQICEDYHDVRLGGTARYGGTLAELESFVRDLWSLRGATWPARGP